MPSSPELPCGAASLTSWMRLRMAEMTFSKCLKSPSSAQTRAFLRRSATLVESYPAIS